jgi:hypothetical protein
MIGNIYDAMQKPAFVFDGRNRLNALEKSVCVSKYRFLGLQPEPSEKREEAEAQKEGFCYIKKLRTTQLL